MSKIYQPEIKREADQIVKTLKESGFFNEFELENEKFATTHFCEKLTEKFIDGKFNDDELFTEEEFDGILKEIIAGSMLNQLKEKGYINSYEDDETEETFFLTEEGKKYMEELKKNTD
jgi:predicted transcriptional regulator